MSNKIIVTKPKSISVKDKKLMQKNGFIVIEAENPQDVKVISEVEILDTSDLLMSALFSITQGNQSLSYQSYFAGELIKRIQKKELSQNNSQEKLKP